MKTLKTINREIARVTNGKVELVKGEGYFYYVYDDGGNDYDTLSVMVYSLRQLDGATWVDGALDFYNKMKGV